jgi:kynurenine formamidase
VLEYLSMPVEEAIAAAAKATNNWGRWGADDVRGTLNNITPKDKVAAAQLVRKGVSFSLAQTFDRWGPQTGEYNRTNPVHTMLLSGSDWRKAVWPHGFSGADDVVFMPLQCSTQWDGLGHIYDHGVGWQGRPAEDISTSAGDLVTGIERVAGDFVSRGVLLDVGRVYGDNGELPDGFAITEEHVRGTIEAQGPTSEVRKGDIVLVRTGQLTRARRDGWGLYAGGPAPGMSFSTVTWLRENDVAGIATDTWGFEVRPNEWPDGYQPMHQVVIPHMGLYIGEIWDFEALGEDCAEDGVYELFLTAGPLPITGGVGAPVNPVAVK